MSRRAFVQRAGFTAAVVPFILPSNIWSAETPPSKRITMGFIGMGKQNRGLLNGFLGKNTKVLAVCDVDTTRRESAKKIVEDFYTKKNEAGYKGCDAYNDFREIMGRKDIDAVCIATPDHWHALIAIAAANAKKDIYCEKPLSQTILEAKAMVTATRKNSVVFQVGSMQRSSREFLKACELVRNGRIGKIQKVVVDVGGPAVPCDLPEEPLEKGLDWNMWLGPTPMRPYNSVLSPRGVHNHFPNWRKYREFGGGGMTDFGAHHYDIAQWGLGMDDSGPIEVTPPEDPKATSGMKYLYANGVEMTHGKVPDFGGIRFIGEHGEIWVNRGKFKTVPEGLDEKPLPETGVKLYHSGNHQQDFLDCIVSRKKPICDVEIGCRTVTVCHLGNLAYYNHRKLKWDPIKQEIVGDAEASKWMERPRRAPWDKPLLSA